MKPMVSIVIPAIPGRIDRLKMILSRLTLNASRHPEITFETIIVDGSAHGEYRELAIYFANILPTKYIHVPIGKFINAGYPRNVGFRLAEGQVFTQIDIDWFVGEDFIAGLAEPYLKGFPVTNNGYMIDTQHSKEAQKNPGYVEALNSVLLDQRHGMDKEISQIFNECKIPAPKLPDQIWLWAAPRINFLDIKGYDEMYCRKWAYCYHPEVEVLSKTRGWISIKDAEKGEEVLTHNAQQDKNEFQQVKNRIVHKNEYKHLIHFKNNLLDIKVTPNHRMLVRKSPDSPWEKMPAENITYPKSYHSYTYATKLAANHPWEKYNKDNRLCFKNHITGGDIGEEEYIALIKFIGYYIAEGHCRKDFSQIQIAKDPNINPKMHKDICSIVSTLGYKPSCSNHTITICDRQFAKWIAENCGMTSATKSIPGFIFEENQKYQKILIATLLSCDGDKESRYATTSEELFQQLQTLCPIVGYYVSINKSKPSTDKWNECFIIKISTRESVGIRNGHINKIPYDDYVYCVEVPNTLLVVRSNGKTMICGNTREDDDLFWRMVFSGARRYCDSFQKFCGLHLWHPASQRGNHLNELNKAYYKTRVIIDKRPPGTINVPEVVANANREWGKVTAKSTAIIDDKTLGFHQIEDWISKNQKDVPPYEKPWENIDEVVESLDN